MGGVLEQIEQWHGGLGELVQEEGLEDSLSVMDGVQPINEGVQEWVSVDAGVVELADHRLVLRQPVKQSVDNDGADVLTHKHQSPADLRTEVLHVQLSGRRVQPFEVAVIQDGQLLVLLRIGQSQPVLADVPVVSRDFNQNLLQSRALRKINLRLLEDLRPWLNSNQHSFTFLSFVFQPCTVKPPSVSEVPSTSHHLYGVLFIPGKEFLPECLLPRKLDIPLNVYTWFPRTQAHDSEKFPKKFFFFFLRKFHLLCDEMSFENFSCYIYYW